MPKRNPLILVEKGAGEQFTPNPIESVRRSNLVGFGDDAANLKDCGRIKKADLRDFGIENPVDIKGLGKAGKTALAGFGVDESGGALEEAIEDYQDKKNKDSDGKSNSSGDSDKDERDRRRKAVIAERGNPAKREPSNHSKRGRGKKRY